MQQIFVEPSAVADGVVTITGEDALHLGRVLRMKPGDEIRISVNGGGDYFGHILEFTQDTVIAKIVEKAHTTELANRILLFQAIPKGDRMETVIEKSVELGVSEIIPVEMKYCVVHLDAKREANRLKRWRAIAESAAKQSKRSQVPDIHAVMKYQEAVVYASSCDICLVPFESAAGMTGTREALQKITPGKSVSIIIGPEGGFAEEEIALARNSMDVISLGRRILRTDTAAITAMSLVMMQSEEALEDREE